MLALFLASAPFCLHAEEKLTQTPGYLVRFWGVDEGMPVASVTDIEQTPEGYLWVGTLLSGLQRFDGVRFMGFNAGNTPELQGMAVRRLSVDGTGRLWINTYANTLVTWDQRGFGLARSTPTQLGQLLWASTNKAVLADTSGRLFYGLCATPEWDWQEVRLETARQPRYCADHSGRIWYVRADGEIGSWQHGETKDSPAVAAPFTNQAVRVLLADSQGFVWLGTDQSLWVRRGDAWAAIPPPEGDQVLAVKRVIPSGVSGVWVEANNRMRRWLNGRWMAESFGWMREMGDAGPLSFTLGDRRGGLWVGYRNGGLLRVEADGAFARLTTRDGLPSDSIRMGVLDREGNLWTGYERGGLVQVRRQPFEVISQQQGLPEPLVNTVCEDPGGAVWIGTHGGTVIRYDADGRGQPRVVEGRSGHDSLVAVDFAGRVWIGMLGVGLMAYENDAARLVASRQDLHGDPRLLLPARDGRLWVGTLDGIWTLDNEQLTRTYDRAAADPKDRPAALVEMNDGTIWAGTFSGALLRWNGAEFERVEPPNFQQLGRTWGLCAGADGSLWVGTTEGGLLRYQAGTFRRYTSRDGLPSDHIVQVMQDALGNLWLGTRAGIARVDEAALARFDRGEIGSLQVSLYGKADGLRTIGSAIEFQPNCGVGRDGRLWFAMINSVVSVAPDQIRINPIAPTVVLETLVADGQPVWPEQMGAVLASEAVPAGGPPIVHVGPGHRHLEFQYTGLSLGSPQRVRFKHKLEGLDEDWIDAGTQRTAVYRYVPPGKYVFRLTACNSDGVWNEESALLVLDVVPHFYETRWFAGLMLCAGAAALVGLVRLRWRRRLAAVERQHALERERTRIAQDLHDDLGASLTEVGLLGALACRPVTPPERMREHLGHITTKAREMVTALDEIVWAVNPKHDSVAALGQYFSEYAQQFLQPTSLRCRIEVADNLPAHPLNSEQRQNLLLAFKEALTNVVRHSQASEVAIQIGLHAGVLEVEVKDNGRGAAQPEATSQADGLLNMRRRLDRIGGQCELRSQPGFGTAVRFRLPLHLTGR